MSDVFNALSSPVRREILEMLKAQDMTAGEIADQLDVGKSTLSGHFNVLKAADLVSTSRSGTTITYSLNTSVVEDLLTSIVGLLSKNKEGKENA
ncbi:MULTISPECIES: autorepressor SdpR family transcription factor [Kordiimonas]|uniref:autorepressor SdpR family transcription factor n=1 Tax=Kordiimonas TaxID=288021 RepID=UPI001FF396A5|nr:MULTISPECIES: autorepressor SdpR family transcription factor [Kordiimonas]MCK0068865.1 autorepressor SdpR family transcription factor [Kordiimonas laminariae]UTW58215.1 winged helix-turn-helix transcriptional regulator [Kordiimonas sp. SCSIO 12603]